MIQGQELMMALAVIAAAGCGHNAARPDAGTAFLFEGFDQAEALRAWREVEGASIGEGPESSVSFDDGAVKLEVGPDTRRFKAVERTVAVAGAPWLRVSARIRTEAVTAGGRYANCNLYIKLPDGSVVTTRVIYGTTPWTTVARRLPIPAGISTVAVGMLLSLPGRAWFDEVRVEKQEAPVWREAVAGRYRYRWLAGDDVPEAARRYNSESYRIVADFLGVAGPAEIVYTKFPDGAAKEELTGNGGNANIADGGIHSIFTTDRHEVVHVLAHAWGDPPAILGEGLAVYLSGSWQGRAVTDYARRVLEEGHWIPLKSLVDTREFRQYPDMVTYAIVGGFVAWVVDSQGKDKLRALYSKLRNPASAEENRQALEEGLGASLDDLDKRYQEWLRAKKPE